MAATASTILGAGQLQLLSRLPVCEVVEASAVYVARAFCVDSSTMLCP